MGTTISCGLRLTPEQKAQVQRIAQERGYLSPSEFLRALVRAELEKEKQKGGRIEEG